MCLCNMDADNDRHLLIEGCSDAVRNVLFKLALREARLQHPVLYIAAAPLDRLPDEYVHQMTANQHQHHQPTPIQFIYEPSAAALAQRLATLHSVPSNLHPPLPWPDLILIESLNTFCGTRSAPHPHRQMSRACLVLATLHDYAAASSRRQSTTSGSERTPCRTVCSLTTQADGGLQLATLRRMFYYADNCFALGRDSEATVYAKVVKYWWNEEV